MELEEGYQGPYWRNNGAVFVVLQAVTDIGRILGTMLKEQQVVDAKLAVHFRTWGDNDNSERAIDEFGEICERLWRLDLRLACAARTAILMSAIDLESDVNKFCYFHTGQAASNSIESLPITSKLEVIHKVLGLRQFKGTHHYGHVRSLVSWRNAFAHGKCTDMPIQSLHGNHVEKPSNYATAQDTVTEVVDLVGGYLEVVKYLAGISRHPLPKWVPGQYLDIQSRLNKIRSYQFKLML